MARVFKLRNKIKGFTDACARFPLTLLFLITIAAVNAAGIATDTDYGKTMLALAVGAVLSAAAQTAYESFFSKWLSRLMLFAGAILLCAGYYFSIYKAPMVDDKIAIRSAIILFGLFIAFIYLPVIKSGYTFGASFMAAFKGLWNSLFYSGVLFGGVSLIIAAIDQLLFHIGYKAYSHAANVIFVLFAAMYFLSLIPKFKGNRNDEEKEKLEKAVFCPKFLEVLISYIVMPLAAVFTVILVIYIALNIKNFWTNSLMEPMAVSYAIAVIVIYILSIGLTNNFARFFKAVFPKIMLPVVLFQIISSVLMATDMGLTHTRYFVIVFGVFAVLSAIVMSFMPVAKNGFIALLLIVFCAVCITPPIDAFTVSRNFEGAFLTRLLSSNGMLQNGAIVKKSSIPEKDMKRIRDTVSYLHSVKGLDQMAYMPKGFDFYADFEKTFGFSSYEQTKIDSAYLYSEVNSFDITGYDRLINTVIDLYSGTAGEFEKGGKNYRLEDGSKLSLLQGTEMLISVDEKEIFDRFASYYGKNVITQQEATFDFENDKAAVRLIFKSLNIDKDNKNADVMVLIKIK